MYIANERLRQTLKSRKEYIHGTKFPADGWIACGSFIVSISSVDYAKVSGTFMGYILLLVIFLMAFYFIYVIIQTIQSFYKKYTYEDLYRDLDSASDRLHDFSLLVVKNPKGKNSGKFLLKYDKRWKCWLFPYTKSHDDNNEQNVLQRAIDIGLSDCNVTFVGMDDFTKPSVSHHNVEKNYRHRYYRVDSENLNSFAARHKKYRRFSIEEMKENDDIMAKNSETVTYVEKNF